MEKGGWWQMGNWGCELQRTEAGGNDEQGTAEESEVQQVADELNESRPLRVNLEHREKQC